MRRYLTLILLLVIQPARIFAATIGIDLGPPAFYVGTNVGPIPFSALNGTALNGSSLSLDFSFSGNEFVRLFSSTASLFEVAITLKTNAGTFPGLVIDP